MGEQRGGIAVALRHHGLGQVDLAEGDLVALALNRLRSGQVLALRHQVNLGGLVCGVGRG